MGLSRWLLFRLVLIVVGVSTLLACGASDERHKILEGGAVISLTEGEIRERIRAGDLGDTSMVFRNGAWILFSEDSRMKECLAAARTPPPPVSVIAVQDPSASSSTSAPASSEDGLQIPMAFVAGDFPMGLSTGQGGGYPLFDVPDAGIKVLPPPGPGQRYQGWIALGGKDRWIILDAGASPRLYIDANGNDNMTDDPGPFPGEREGDLPNHFTIMPGPKNEPYRLWAFQSNMGGMRYYAACYRAGHVPGENGAALVLFDADADFDYANDGLVVDLDGDGKCGEGELIKVGGTFQFAGRAYELLSIAPDGSFIVFNE